MNIGLIENDLELGCALQRGLQDAGHDVVWTRRIDDARDWNRDSSFAVLLLDLALSDGTEMNPDGCFSTPMRTVPVLVISVRDSLEGRLDGLQDYLVKPFAMSDLLDRLAMAVRRADAWCAMDDSVWNIKDLVLDEKRFMVTRAGRLVRLSEAEFALLATLAKYSGQVLTRRELEVKALPGKDRRAFECDMSSLRRKIGDGYIHTVSGIGYTVGK